MYKDQSLYKFQPINECLIENIKNHQIYFNDPKDYNDPFDSTFYLDLGHSQKEMNYEKLKSIISSCFGNFIENDKYSKLPPQFPLNRTNIRYQTKNHVVSCFSGCYKNTLLWSHYANNHKGIVLEFKFENCFQGFIHQVGYEIGYPIYKISNLDKDLFPKLIKHSLIMRIKG
jgi:Protein of unknown function (DUF2971)